MRQITGQCLTDHCEAEELAQKIGQSVLIHGVIYKIRQMSGFAFIILQTKRQTVQCIYTGADADFPLDSLNCGMSVILNGDVMTDERSRSGYELRIRSCTILSRPAENPPLVINNKMLDLSLDTLLDYRPLTLRHQRERAIFRIQEGIAAGFRHFLAANRFTEIHSPKIVYSGAEGGANIFRIDYFGREAFLAQSPQFYKQIMVGVYERVFEIAPVFRAEKHHTARHVNEYTSVDLEMGFISNFAELMALEVRMIRETLQYLQEQYSDDLALLQARLPDVREIPALPFDEAKHMIAQSCHREITDWSDFDPEEERLLGDLIRKQTGSEFVFVTHYHSDKRPFYTLDTPGNPQVTESFDLLFRGLEVTTGGQRIHDYHDQVAKMQARGMNPDLFASYLMAHQYGLPPHGGMGIGLERFTARLLELSNIRQATLFPRDTERLEP